MYKTDAVISDCRRYRYQLSREWGVGPSCNFIMLNPSTADAEMDDPTIRRCVSFAKKWGCGKLIVTNLFGFRATNPKYMKAADDPVGPENMKYVEAAAKHADWHKGYAGFVVCAWGANGSFMNQADTVLRRLVAGNIRPMCLAKTKAGLPRHPLYLKVDLWPNMLGAPSIRPR